MPGGALGLAEGCTWPGILAEHFPNASLCQFHQRRRLSRYGTRSVDVRPASMYICTTVGLFPCQ